MTRPPSPREWLRPASRRTFLIGTGLFAGLVLAQPWLGRVAARPRFDADPFTLGVASGDPLPDGVVLWTRLAPAPFEADGGLPPQPVEVAWEVTDDDAGRSVVRSGVAIARPEAAHTVHIEVDGLEPGRPYWYRFRAGEAESPLGRTRTAPAPSAPVDQLRLAFASCQNWLAGLYTAYRDLAARELDLVVFLGDYIYEGQIPASGGVRRGSVPPLPVRVEADTLDRYRLRYALYKLDPHLQAAHAACPWVVTPDDHEVKNDYAALSSRPFVNPNELVERRAAAYQAYWEHMPLRRAARPAGPDMRLYRRLAFGDLLELHVLDTRQYRSYQHGRCGDAEQQASGGYCRAALDPARSLLGAAQRRWLLDGLAASTVRWPVLANQVPFARRNLSADPALPSFGGDGDKWDGYAAEREAVLRALAEIGRGRPFNPLIITGDVHTNWVFDLKADWDDPASATVGVELVGTSISSNGDDPLTRGGFATRCGPAPENPHNLFYDDHRGYVALTLTPDRCQADYRVLPTVRDPAAAAWTIASFAVEAGHPGAHLNSACPVPQPRPLR